MTNTKPSISIVTRLSRPEMYLERVLEGLLLQTGALITWSIVSQTPLTAGHKACVKRAEKNGITCLVSTAKLGLSLGCLANIGVKVKYTDYVLLHDDDDCLNSDFIGPALELLLKTDFIGIACHSAIIAENGGKNKLKYILSPGRKSVSRKDLLLDNKIVTNGLIFRRTAFDNVDGYPEDVGIGEDWVFYLNLLRSGSFGVLPKVCANVFVRNKKGIDPLISNTCSSEHEVMRKIIRMSENQTPHTKVSTVVKIKRKSVRTIDRIVFTVFNTFLPRF